MNFRLSAGKGYRTVHPLAEYNYLLASGRHVELGTLSQEEAWNYGASANFKIRLFGHILDLSADYFYTHFLHQTAVDMDADVTTFRIADVNGRSFSHTAQLEATYTLFRGMTLTAAYRYNHVRQTSGGKLRERPLTSRYKALLTASYKTPLEIWQFDVTATLNGGGRLPLHYIEGTDQTTADARFPAYAGLNAQVTRWFRHFSIYVGGENLTNYRQKLPILNAHNPWSERFDATQVWGPVHGAMVYAGLRFNLGKI